MKRNKLTKLAGVAAAVAMLFSSLTVSAAEDSVYTTQRGDNLSKIAQNVYGDKARWKDIYDANRDVIKDPNKIWANQQLVIPGGVITTQQPIPQDTTDTWPETSAEWQAAVAAGGPSYIEQNNLQFYQGTSYKTQGRRHVEEDPSVFEFFESNGVITGITIRDAEREGYQVVTISAMEDASCAVHNWGDLYFGYVNVPDINICDIYTGKVLPSAATDGDVELVNTANLAWGGVPYSIDYITKFEWTQGEWSEWDEDGNCYEPMTLVCTYTIAIPKGYDGLAILVNPITEAPSTDIEYNVFNNDEEEYIMDEWKDGSCLMRVSDLYNTLNR